MNPEDSPPCEICGQKSQGAHFGVISCRACAAFFRRSSGSKLSNMGCLSQHCDEKIYHCKPCRLKTCISVGMDTNKFQHGHDSIKSTMSNQKRKMPQTVEICTGKPPMALYLDTKTEKPKNLYIDMTALVSEALRILEMGAETPLIAENSLGKLKFGYSYRKRTQELRKVSKVTQKEVTSFWKFHMLATAKWLTYFDSFQVLDKDSKSIILLSVWHVWGRLDKLMATALYRTKDRDTEKMNTVIGNEVVTNQPDELAGSSWMSRYPTEQLRYFLDGIRGSDLTPLSDDLQSLDPTETEVTFMMAQLCFQYVASRFGGKVSEIMEHFLEILSNGLHHYYIDECRYRKYSGRLLKIMTINRKILENVRTCRSRADVAKVFDVFNLDFSHPEMFRDTGFI